jgi:hypothetical protein
MRWGAYILAAMLIGGCAHAGKPAAKPQASLPIKPHTPSAAGALVFDAPITQGQPPLQLSREGRSPDAFVGYESITATYFYVRSDDRMTSDHSDRFERRAITTRVGVSYR